MDNVFSYLKNRYRKTTEQFAPIGKGQSLGKILPIGTGKTQQAPKPTALNKSPQQVGVEKAKQEALNKFRQNPKQDVQYSVQPSGAYTTRVVDQSQNRMVPINKQQQNTEAQTATTTTGTGEGQVAGTQTTTPDYMAQYQKYLQDREARARGIAEEQYGMAQREAENVYNKERAALEQQAQRAGESIQQYRQRIQQDLANLEGQRGRSITGAREESGASQRQLAMTRRQQAGELERKYAALGTIDSYGVGSFTGANTNLETEFLRQTNENLQKLQGRIQDIDTQFNTAVIEGNRKIQDEENKYQDAVREINRLLAGNESLRTQALQQASSLLRQKQLEIQDDVENLRLQLEKDKYDTQQKLQAEQVKDQAIIAEFAKLSDDFKRTGVPSTAQDAFFANKYPDYMKNLKDIYTAQQKSSGASKMTEKQAQFNNASQAAQQALDLLEKGNLQLGPGGFVERGFRGFTGTETPEMTQYKSTLSLAVTLAKNAMLGAAMSPSEMKSLEDAIPKINDYPEVQTEKLRTFIRLLQQFSQNQANVTPNVSNMTEEQLLQSYTSR